MTNTQAAKSIETFNVTEVINLMGYIPNFDFNYELDVYVDQDRHSHIVLKSKYYSASQLNDVYSSLFGTGTMCMKRSRSYRAILAAYPEGTSHMTIASIIQYLFYAPKDMKLMATLTAWIDGMLV
jgi:hypothetical protein